VGPTSREGGGRQIRDCGKIAAVIGDEGLMRAEEMSEEEGGVWEPGEPTDFGNSQRVAVIVNYNGRRYRLWDEFDERGRNGANRTENVLKFL